MIVWDLGSEIFRFAHSASRGGAEGPMETVRPDLCVGAMPSCSQSRSNPNPEGEL
jgi:hypothetical protein